MPLFSGVFYSDLKYTNTICYLSIKTSKLILNFEYQNSLSPSCVWIHLSNIIKYKARLVVKGFH